MENENKTFIKCFNQSSFIDLLFLSLNYISFFFSLRFFNKQNKFNRIAYAIFHLEITKLFAIMHLVFLFGFFHTHSTYSKCVFLIYHFHFLASNNKQILTYFLSVMTTYTLTCIWFCKKRKTMKKQ